MTAPGRAPAHLSKASKAWWKAVVEEYAVEQHQLRTLTLACEAFDRAVQAREILERDGIVTEDRYGGLRAHPAVAIERDSRLAYLRAVRELGLEGDGPTVEARPPRTASGRGLRAVR